MPLPRNADENERFRVMVALIRFDPGDATQPGEAHVAIIGAGSIGLGFCIALAQAGCQVVIYDPDPDRLHSANDFVTARLSALAENALLAEPAASVLERVRVCSELNAALSRAVYIQECAPEDLELKKTLYRQLDALAQPDVVIGSSTSAIPASHYAADLPGRGRCLVCHPTNPPYLLKVVEIVPAPFTSPDAVEKAREFLTSCAFTPILIRKEIEGFALNRLQGALLREAYCLVRDSVLSVDEVDTLVRDALGLRWSFMGPFETADLNTRGGLASHAQKLGPAYSRMAAERGQMDRWTDDLVATVVAERRKILPIEEWENRGEWRDARLMALLQHKQEMLRRDEIKNVARRETSSSSADSAR